MCFQRCSSSSQHVPQGCSQYHLILSHMVCPQFSPSHLHRWAKGNVLHLHIEASINLWSFQSINYFVKINFLGVFGDGPIKMMFSMPGMYLFATNTSAPPPKKRLPMLHKMSNSKKVSNLCLFFIFFSF